MVEHYNYEDDGIELNSMRKVRTYMLETKNEDYLNMLKVYSSESITFVEYIESQENKEEYYSRIKNVVLGVVDLVEKEQIDKATELYWDFYVNLKKEIKQKIKMRATV